MASRMDYTKHAKRDMVRERGSERARDEFRGNADIISWVPDDPRLAEALAFVTNYHGPSGFMASVQRQQRRKDWWIPTDSQVDVILSIKSQEAT